MNDNLLKTSPAEPQSSQSWMPRFFTIWGGQAFSLLGSQLVQFALIWWLTQKTGSATVLATATLVALLPQVFLGPLVGALVDRWSRRWTMVIADACIAICTLLLGVLFWTGQVQVWHIYIFMFLRSVGGGFHWPAMQASTSLMVPKEHLSRIQGINQVLNGALGIGSAPLAALLLAVMPMQHILFIDIGTALLAIAPLLFIAVPQPARSVSQETSDGKTSLGQDLKAGFRYVWAWPGLFIIMLMAALINFLLTPAGSLQPILVTRHFGGQALELAYLESAWGIGMLVGGLTLSAWGGFRRRVVTAMAGIILMGATMSLIGLVPASGFWLAAGLIFLTGFANPIVNGPLIAAVQAAVAPEMQGRVFTLMVSVASAMTPLSLIVAGPIADQLGVRTWYVIGGLVTILIGAVAFFIPAVMHFEDGRTQPKLAPQAEATLPAAKVQPGAKAQPGAKVQPGAKAQPAETGD